MDYREIIKKIKQSIGKVVVLDGSNNIIGTGSGFVFLKKGILVTCNHVIKDSSSVVIKFPQTDFIVGKTVIQDEEHDLALVKFENSDIEPLEFDSEEVQEGMEILFAGYPLNLNDLTTHQGIISAVTKDISGITTYLIDGTVNSGNSGCPLINNRGQVLGIVNAKRRERSDLLSKIENMEIGAVSLHGVDLVEIYQALINNVQLGIGYAVPASYIPQHKEIGVDAPDPQEKELIKNQETQEA